MSLLANCSQALASSEKEGSVRNRGRGHAGFAKTVGRCDRKLSVRGDDKHVPKLAREEEVTPIRHRRRGETFTAGAEAFVVGNSACPRIEAGQHTVVETAVNAVADDDGCLHVIALSRVG